MKYKNVLCVYPYKKELKTIGFFPPLGLEYIANAIENMVDSLKIIDLRYEREPFSSFSLILSLLINNKKKSI